MELSLDFRCKKSDKYKKIEFFAFEIFLDKIPSPKRKVFAKPLLKLNYLQSLSRDFSFLINDELNVEDLKIKEFIRIKIGD